MLQAKLHSKYWTKFRLQQGSGATTQCHCNSTPTKKATAGNKKLRKYVSLEPVRRIFSSVYVLQLYTWKALIIVYRPRSLGGQFHKTAKSQKCNIKSGFLDGTSAARGKNRSCKAGPHVSQLGVQRTAYRDRFYRFLIPAQSKLFFEEAFRCHQTRNRTKP